MRSVGSPETPGIVPLRSTPIAPVAQAEKAAPVRPDAGDAAVVTRTSAGDAAPVQADRVTEIRKAIEEDRYPLLPVKIADALIAASIFGVVK